MKGMDMKTVYSVISLSVLVILLLVTPVIGSSDWVEYCESKDGNIYSYNKVNIKKDRKKGIVQVWTKEVFSDGGREEYIQHRKEKIYTTKGYDKLSHTLILQEIDCKNEMIKELSVIDYNTDDRKLFSITWDEPHWEYITPGMSYDELRKKVCN